LSIIFTSSVYKVEDIKTKKVYAAKIFNKSTRHFKQEKELLTFLKNKGTKNIVNIIDSGDEIIKFLDENEKYKYLILEYAEKKELTRYISMIGNGFSEKKSHAQLLFLKILEAVKGIHKNGVCHRDLKEDNILLDIKFNPKISDFGFSTYIQYR
jgi:serine/threonine protein kinase